LFTDCLHDCLPGYRRNRLNVQRCLPVYLLIVYYPHFGKQSHFSIDYKGKDCLPASKQSGDCLQPGKQSGIHDCLPDCLPGNSSEVTV